jgi:predicted nucleic acid-binding protein
MLTLGEGSMMAYIPGTRNITGLSWCLDTNIVYNPDFEFIRRLFEVGWIYLQTPSTVFMELSNRKDPEAREELLELRNPFCMPMGIMVLGHAQLDLAVFASEADVKLLHQIHERLWNTTFEEDAAKSDNGVHKAQNRIRDSMIAHTSIRYGASALLTQDQRLLKGASAVLGLGSNFQILSLESAKRIALHQIARKRYFKTLKPNSVWVKDLPDWPEETPESIARSTPNPT